MSGKIIKKIGFSSGIGAGIGIIISSVIIFLIAAVLSAMDIPAMMIAPATVFAIAGGSFFGGFVSSKICGEKGIVCGAFSGVIFFAVLLLAGTFFEGGNFGTGGIIKTAMIMISCMTGGIIGVNYIKRK